MDYHLVSEAIRGNLRDCAKRGVRVTRHPPIEDVWSAVGGDGPLALLVTLEYIAARQEIAKTHQLRLDRERVFAGRGLRRVVRHRDGLPSAI